MHREPRPISRRDALKKMGAGSAALAALVANPGIGRAQRVPYQLGCGLYGMQSLPHMEALGHVARIGYPHVELTLRPGWDTEPSLLSRADRIAIRQRIDDLGLTLVDVMEGMRPVAVSPETTLAANLERLRAAAEVAHECSPGAPALIQSPIGGSRGAFMEVRESMAEEISAWADTLDELDVVFCIKPHSGQAMGRPEHLLWMLEQIDHPRIKGVYDYSHFQAFGLDMNETIRQVVPHCGFVHMKDTVGRVPDHRFVLPGDGGVDYAEMLRTMAEVGYTGPLVTEVSAHVFNLPDYDPVATAELLWERLSPIFSASESA